MRRVHFFALSAVLGLESACTGAFKWQTQNDQAFYVKRASVDENSSIDGDETVTFEGRCFRNIPVVVSGAGIYFRTLSNEVLTDSQGQLVREAMLKCTDDGMIGTDYFATDGTPLHLRLDDAATDDELNQRDRGEEPTETRHIDVFQRDANNQKSPMSFGHDFVSNFCKNSPATSTDFTIGAGTAVDPYRICNVYQFWHMQALSNAKSPPVRSPQQYRLKTDLGLQNTVLDYNASSQKPTVVSLPSNVGIENIDSFFDHFDGENRTLTGFRIRNSHLMAYDGTNFFSHLGIFPTVKESAQIENLHIDDCQLDFSDFTNDTSDWRLHPTVHAGCLAGDIIAGQNFPIGISRILIKNSGITDTLTDNSYEDRDSFYGLLAGTVSAVTQESSLPALAPQLSRIYIGQSHVTADSNVGCFLGGALIQEMSNPGDAYITTPLQVSDVTCQNPILTVDHNVGLFAGQSRSVLNITRGSFTSSVLSSSIIRRGSAGAIDSEHDVANVGGLVGLMSSSKDFRAAETDQTSISDVQIDFHIDEEFDTSFENVGGIAGNYVEPELGLELSRVSVAINGQEQNSASGVIAFGGVFGTMASVGSGNITLTVNAFSLFSNIGAGGANLEMADPTRAAYFVGIYQYPNVAGFALQTSAGSYLSSVPNLNGTGICDPATGHVTMLNHTVMAGAPQPKISTFAAIDPHSIDTPGANGVDTIQDYFGSDWVRFADEREPLRYIPRLRKPYDPTKAGL